MPEKKKERNLDDLELEVDLEKSAAGFGVITMGELRKFIKDQKLMPTDLFSTVDVLEDPIMKGAVADGVKFEKAYEQELAIREEKKMETKDNNFDILPGGDTPTKKEQEKKIPSKEEEEIEDLMPAGGETLERKTNNEGDQGEDDDLQPG